MLVRGWLERSKVSGGWLGCRVSTGMVIGCRVSTVDVWGGIIMGDDNYGYK